MPKDRVPLPLLALVLVVFSLQNSWKEMQVKSDIGQGPGLIFMNS